MTEKNQQVSNKEEDPKTSNGFTGMPSEKPFPDFEPEMSVEKHIEQFEETAENGRTDSSEKQ